MPDRPDPRRLLRDGVLGADLLGLLWLLLEVRTPVVVVGTSPAGNERVIDDLAPLLPAGARVVEVRPDDDFAGVPEAGALGWRTGGAPAAAEAPSAAAVGTGPAAAGVLRVRGLAAPGGVEGDRARVVIRALAAGYGLLATMPGAGLEDALEALRQPAVGADPDEQSHLGVVLALAEGAGGPRVAAAHYLRPVAADAGGHVHRLPPAVLSTWNEARGTYDDFSWGLAPELAGRLGLRPAELEREQARRAALLAGDHPRAG